MVNRITINRILQSGSHEHIELQKNSSSNYHIIKDIGFRRNYTISFFRLG